MGLFSDLKTIDEKKGNENPAQEKKDTKNAIPLPDNRSKAVEKNNCQLNAWISGEQNQLLEQIFYRLRGSGVKIKKGELIGVAIEILSRILENQKPSTLDKNVLDSYIQEKLDKQ